MSQIVNTVKHVFSRGQRQAFPLSVALEGQSWVLTALVETTVALWMVMLRSERSGFMMGLGCLDGQWAEELLNYLFFMLIGAIGAGLSIGVLSMNFRPPTAEDWRPRTVRSTFALIILDLVAIDHVLYIALGLLGVETGKTVKNTNSVGEIIAAVFMTCCGVGCTIAFNVLYVQQFGCCACCRSERTANELLQRSREYVSSISETPVAEMVEASIRKADMELEKDQEESRKSSNDESYTRNNFFDDSGSSSMKTDETDKIGEASSSTHVLQRWDTVKLIELGSNKLSKQKPLSKLSSNPCEVIVENETIQSREKSNRLRMKIPIAPDVSKIVQRFLANDDMTLFSRMKITKGCLHEIWESVKEEPGRFRYAVWIKSAFFTSVIVLIYTCIRTLAIIKTLVEGYEENREKFVDHMTSLDQCVRDAGWENGMDTIGRMLTIKAYLLIDRVILDYKYTGLVGYPLGTLFALYGLVAVLIQHKRMSLAVSESLTDFNSLNTSSTLKNTPWLEFQRKYPILHACMFLAILSSTAVVQSQIVSTFISIFLGLVVNYTRMEFLLNIGGFYFLAYVLVFLIDVVLMRVLKSSLISEDGYGIRHPRWFNFCMVVLSLVHLVLGILYALWRVLYLFVTTVFVLNRLDVCLFTTGKTLDNGHNAFMSMLVLTVLIQQDSEPHIKKTESKQSSDSI